MIQTCLVCGKEIVAMAYKGTGACSQPHVERLRLNAKVQEQLEGIERVRIITAPPPDLTEDLLTFDDDDEAFATPERVRLVTAPAPDVTRPLATMDVSYLIDWHDDDGWTDWVAYGTAKSPEAAHAVVDEMLTHPHAPKRWRIVKVTTTRDTIEETP